MANEVNIYTPRYLAEVVRQAPPVHTFFRDTFFTNVKKSTTERVDIDLVKGDRRMAAFVHPRVGGKVLKASGYKKNTCKNGCRHRLSEYWREPERSEPP